MHHHCVTTYRTKVRSSRITPSRNILEDDLACVNLSADDLACRKDYRMAVIFDAIRKATQHTCHCWRGNLCPKLRELWLEVIEGSDTTDDMWLWVDGDEQWLREKSSLWHLVQYSFGVATHKGDWLDSQSALRRRIHRPSNNAGQLAERIRNATPEQRVAAICWLTWNSGRVKALAIELGCTPLGMFGPWGIVNNYSVDQIRDLWETFPTNIAAWEEVVKKLEEDKCTCLKTSADTEQRIRCWFNMLTWLDGKPPTLEAIGGDGCTRCQSWCVLRLALSLYCDKDSEGLTHAMTNVDTGLRVQTTQTSRYGMPYVSVLRWMAGLHVFSNW